MVRRSSGEGPAFLGGGRRSGVGAKDDVNSILILKELWRRRLLVVVSFVAAAAIAVVAVYEVSVAPPSISKRAQRDAQGSIGILVDSAKSPIADVGRNLTPLTVRAGVFARYIGGGNVIRRIAKDTGIPVKQIEVAGPVPLPGEAPGAAEAPPQTRPYGIEIAQRDELPIVNVATRAPTVRAARDLAAAVPEAIGHVVESIQERQGIPPGSRVKFRVLGPAQAAPVIDALGAKVAVLLFVVLLTLFIVLILAIPRFVAAWKTPEPEAGSRSSHGSGPPSVPALHEVTAEEGGDPGQPQRAVALRPDARERSGPGS